MTMTSIRNTTDNPLSDLLTNAARELDLPPEMRDEIYGIYDRAGAFLSDHLDDSADWQVYSQGSIRIGTVVRPSADADYDLDAVVRWNKRKEQLTQVDLKSGVGTVIHGFARSEANQPSPPTGCDEGARCWTVTYRGLHVDWLPAIPDDESSSDSGILLTDRKLTRWQHGDPVAYANWFHQQTREFELRKIELAHKASVDVEDIPDSEVRTTLHRLAQVLKIHRNEWFAADTTNQPPSIIITHLAALSYNGGSLIDELADAAARMPSFISRGTDGGWILENPVQPKENFADRWDDARQVAFDNWINRLRRDIDDLDALPTGLEGLVHRLGESFGHDTITKAAGRYEAAVHPTQSDSGKDFLSRLHGGDAITTSGAVTATSSTPRTRAWRP